MEKSGLCLIKRDGKNILMCNGKEISATALNDGNRFGVSVTKDRLDVDSVGIAKSADQASVVERELEAYFNEVKLVNTGECVNITKSDYNLLLGGALVKGYKRFESSTIYNIVDDVLSAPVITYEIADGTIVFSNGNTADAQSDMVYNSVANVLSENSLNQNDTFTNTRCPFVCVKYFDPVIPIGGTITLKYYVDAQNIPSLYRGQRNNTFTVIVRVNGSDPPVKKTTYAGEFEITTPSFNTRGETWFSIECIDSNGVGSPVQYFDVLVRDEVTQNYYQMEEADLAEFGIVCNNNDPQVAYANKAALSNFFAAVKQNGFNGVVMLNRIYYIDYHSVFGTQAYKKAGFNLSERQITSIDDCTEQDVIDAGVFCTEGVSAFPSVGSFLYKNASQKDFNAWAEKRVKDGYLYFVKNTSTQGNDIVFPDEFTVNLNRATIKAAPTTDLPGGYVALLRNNFDAHIINGNLVGNYNEYQWDINKIRIGSENPSEWLGVIGTKHSKYCSFEDLDISYAMGYDGVFGGDNGGRGTYDFGFTYGKRVGSDGALIDAEGFGVTKLIPLVQSDDEVKFGRYGYCGYYFCKKRELFYSFYNGDTFIKTIKSKSYFCCKIPAGSTHFRMTVYADNSEDVPIATNNGELRIWLNPTISKNILVKGCTWHDTRSCAMAPTYAKGLAIVGCHFYNVAIEEEYGITSVISDFEDGWQNTQNVAFIGCEKHGGGSRTVIMHFANGLDFSNNRGISLYDYGGIEYGFIEGNEQMEILSIGLNPRCLYPFVKYSHNDIKDVEILYTNSRDGFNIIDTDVVNPYIGMDGSNITNECTYDKLRLVDTMNGEVWN